VIDRGLGGDDLVEQFALAMLLARLCIRFGH